MCTKESWIIPFDAIILVLSGENGCQFIAVTIHQASSTISLNGALSYQFPQAVITASKAPVAT